MNNVFSTTLTDRNGVELFNGDLVNNEMEFADPMFNPYRIEFDHGSFIMRSVKYPYKYHVLRNMLDTEEGEYISNFGNVENIVSNKLPVEKVVEMVNEWVNPFKDEINLKGMDIIASLGEKILKIEEFVQNAKKHQAVSVFAEGNMLMNSWKNALALARPRRTWYGCMQYKMFARVEEAEMLVVVYERKFNLFMNKWGIV